MLNSGWINHSEAAILRMLNFIWARACIGPISPQQENEQYFDWRHGAVTSLGLQRLLSEASGGAVFPRAEVELTLAQLVERGFVQQIEDNEPARLPRYVITDFGQDIRLHIDETNPEVSTVLGIRASAQA